MTHQENTSIDFTEYVKSADSILSEYLREVQPVLVAFINRNNKSDSPLEVALANEIRMMNDHLARCFTKGMNPEQIQEELKKAEGHLQRLEYDAYKQMNWILYDETIRKVEKRRPRLELMKGWKDFKGNEQYYELRNAAIEAVEKAKMFESNGLKRSEVLPEFKKGFDIYRELEDYVKSHRKDFFLIRIKWFFNSFFPIVMPILLLYLGKCLLAFLESGMYIFR